MSYFKNFPKIIWNDYLVNDITFRINIVSEIKKSIGSWEAYRITEGQKIEEIAHKIYGSVDYEWVIMLMNDIIDPIYDWPLSQEELVKYSTNKYGANLYNVHHWEKNNRVYATNPGDGVAISNYEYEDISNENNREILLLKPQYISSIVSEFEKLIADYK